MSRRRVGAARARELLARDPAFEARSMYLACLLCGALLARQDIELHRGAHELVTAILEGRVDEDGEPR